MHRQTAESLMNTRLSAKETAYLARARVCRVGSVDGRGVPHVAPLCHAFDRERQVAYVATGGRTAANLKARPRATLECDDYFEDWDRLRGVVARARADIVEHGPELDRARRLLRRKFKQYRDTEFDSVIALRVVQATSWGL